MGWVIMILIEHISVKGMFLKSKLITEVTKLYKTLSFKINIYLLISYLYKDNNPVLDILSGLKFLWKLQ